jgi:uncharacterized damage-inducible protein DinB
MDSIPDAGPVIGGPSAASLSLLDLSAWIGYQLEQWAAWAESRDEEWLTWPTLNERYPTLGNLYIHAFSPLHRYADQVVGDDPADDTGLNIHAWIAVHTWAQQCQQRHYSVCAGLALDDATRMIHFRTRSAGVLYVSVGEALTHACTHCFWHLGGIAHLLRLAGTAPPQGSDMILWAARRHDLLGHAAPDAGHG